MLKNWSKVVLVSMLVVALAAPAFASTARVRTLANTGDYLSDDSNIFRWYSTLPSYANMVQAELGTWGSYYAMAPSTSYYGDAVWLSRALSFNYACGEEGKWGTWRISLIEGMLDSPGFWSVNPFMQLHSPSNGMSGYMSSGELMTPVNKLDIAGGWEVNENIAVGVTFTRSSWSYKGDGTSWDIDDYDGDRGDTNSIYYETADFSHTFTTLGAGLTWSNNEDMIADLAVTLGFGGVEGEGTDSTDYWDGDPATPTFGTMDERSAYTLENDNGMAMSIAARMFYDWKDYVTLVPMIEFSTSEYVTMAWDMEQEDLQSTPAGYQSVSDISLSNKTTYMKFGVGMDLEVNGSNTLLFALEYANLKWEYDDMHKVGVSDTVTNDDDYTEYSLAGEQTWTALPTIRLALETEITSWLTTRIGAVKSLVKYKYDTESSNIDYWDGDGYRRVDDDEYTTGMWGITGFEWFLGAGFNIAEWTIDMEIAPETPFSMGWWLHGYSAFDDEDYGPIYSISASYSF